MSTSCVSENKSFNRPFVSSYVGMSAIAAASIIPVFPDFLAKSALQNGNSVPKTSWLQGMRVGLKASPSVGGLVGAQMFLHKSIASEEPNIIELFRNAVIVGAISSPITAGFNIKGMGGSFWAAFFKITPKQLSVITVQETAFVGGITGADHLFSLVKPSVGDNKIAEYFSTFIAGAAGSLAGHPANTALTRWQNGKTLDSFAQSWWGAIRKARAIGLFSILYKFGKKKINQS